MRYMAILVLLVGCNQQDATVDVKEPSGDYSVLRNTIITTDPVPHPACEEQGWSTIENDGSNFVCGSAWYDMDEDTVRGLGGEHE
jgi:hypothetical protein